MNVLITVNYECTLDDDDVESIKNGRMTLDDIDWLYYIRNAKDIFLDNVKER